MSSGGLEENPSPPAWGREEGREGGRKGGREGEGGREVKSYSSIMSNILCMRCLVYDA